MSHRTATDKLGLLARASWLFLAVVAWALTFYLSTHHSEHASWFRRYSPPYMALLFAMVGVATLLALTNLPRPQHRCADFIRNTLLTLAGVAAAIVAVEVFVRFVDPLGISYYEFSARYHLAKVADPGAGLSSSRRLYGDLRRC